MKKFLYLSLLCGLSYGPGFAQLARNSGSQLPPNFQSDRQAAYNNMPNPDVTFQQYYNNEQARFFHEDALRLDPSLRYRPGPSRPSMCGNGDFEAGLDPNEWQGGYGYVDGSGNVLYSSFANGLSSGLIGDFNAHQTTTGTGPDPYVPISTTAPTGSTHAVRIGNAAAQNGAELLSKTFVVPSDKSIVSFWYALVLENPNDHIPIAQPAFRVRVLDANGNVIPGLVDLGNGSDVAISDVTNPFFMSANGPSGLIAYRDWSCASINLTSLIGQQVTVQFVTNDCAMGAHFGYAYIDDFCGSCSSNPYNMSLARTTCGTKSQVCIDYQLPAQGSLTGSVNIDLNIYQNGNLLMTLNSGQLSSGTNYCFDFAPTAIPGMNPALGGFDYTAVGHFAIGSTALSPFYLFAPPDGAVTGQNNDCSFSQQCCPGKNLIENGDFEAGNTGFGSEFTYQPNVAANSVWIDQYGVVNDAEAQTVASTWNPECPSTGNHLVVNGATGQAGSYRIAWEQKMEVKPGTYKFCGDFKALNACAFNVNGPRIIVNLTSGSNYSNTRVTILPTSGSCNWKRVERTLTVPDNATSLSITITLNETMEGDGNDLAMDNFSLVRLDSVPEADVTFGLVPSNFNGWNYNLTATPDVSLPGGCYNYWEVAEVDPNNNYEVIPGTNAVTPTPWVSLNVNNFIGYVGSSSLSGTAPGLFDMRKTYRIVYGRSCSCLALSRRYVLYGPVLSRGAAQRDNASPQILQSGILNDAVQAPAASAENAKANANTSQAQIRIFPNPTSGKVSIQKSAADADYTVKVLNSLGQVVATVSFKKADLKTEFSMGGVAPGTYIVHVVSADGAIVHSEKITKL